MRPYLNRLEPEGLVGHFLACPPQGFSAWVTASGGPMFRARFDLLTTADDGAKRLVRRLPGFRFWKGLLQPRTAFVGTTVSEYALLATGTDPARLAAQLKAEYGGQQPFLIVKDLPQDSPLLSAEENDYAAVLARACQAEGFVLVEGQALAYVPIDFASLDAYLERVSYSRRKNIRRKLRSRAGLDIERVRAGDARFARPEVLREFYALYRNVYDQSEMHFDLLTEDFFQRVLQDGESGGIVFVYRREGRMIGYNICFECDGNLVDKYIGFQYPDARDNNLYFVSWMVNLEYALERGLRHYIAGWTDPEVKSYLGASFTFTRHAVYIRNPLLRAVLKRFAGRFEGDRTWSEGEKP
ncbi:MAG: GNAT family N-acetyltransferase [Bordetella sp. SCN 67-23]|nr:MAG: GNAT family N-acetyltransferase [Bordetella sp. SCN 67-23]ODU75034.1 MAG: GNAT family N-acetyltransferase [Bordetella sp. SCN 68-11]OJW87548.1 MAG: GNAT family N-acetyltransferase [Burkholderiales bacterium 67-32]